MVARARLSADGLTVSLSTGRWSMSFPVERLPQQIRFYTDLRDRPHKDRPEAAPFEAFYAPTVDALERIQRVAALMRG